MKSGATRKGGPGIALFRAALLILGLLSAVPATAGRPGIERNKDFLTLGERAWLANHPVIRITPERNYAPFIFMDKDRKINGISADYITLLEKKLGIRFQMMDSKNLSLILEEVQQGKADVVTSLMKNAQRSEFLLFTAPYISVPAVIITRKGFSGDTDLDSPGASKIAVGKGYGVQAFLQEKYAGLTLVPLDDDEVCLTKVSFGELDAAVVDLASASRIIENLKITNLHVAGTVDFNYELSFAVRKDWPELCTILEKGISHITTDESNEIYNKWIRLNQPWPFSPRIIWTSLALLLCTILLVSAGAVLWNRSLKINIREKTEELRTELAERRRVESSLIRSEELYRLTLSNISDAVFITDDQGRFTFVCPNVHVIFGYSREEVLTMGNIPALLGTDPAAFGLLESDGERQNIELEITDSSGRNHFLLINVKRVSIAGGTRLYSCRDVTERKLAEEKLREREEMFSSIVSQAMDAIALVDHAGRFVEFNTAAHEGLGYSHEEFAALAIPDIQAEHSPEQIRANMENVLSQGGLVFETRHRHRNGEIRNERVSLRPLHIRGHEYYAAVWTDVTDYKRAEEALRQSLEEKVVLLKEVHHRVKNNLQIVASLLGLQAGRSDSEQVVSVLQDTRNRVRSMALLHETLYRSGNLARINFAIYLKDLCGQLLQTYSASTNRVRVEYQVDEIGLPLEQAVPCGLIVSELVSNALKHGFPDNRTGKVLVGLRSVENQSLDLTIHDDGVGLPAAFDPALNSTLGMKLISGLVAQMRGKMEIERSKGSGASFRIVFSAPLNMRAGGEA